MNKRVFIDALLNGKENNFLNHIQNTIVDKTGELIPSSDTVSNAIYGGFDIGFTAGFYCGTALLEAEKASRKDLKRLLKELDEHIEFDKELARSGKLKLSV
jgi:hypothetical protein